MQKFKFSIYVNTNVIQGLVCKKKPRVLFFSKAHNQACKHVNCMRKFSILQMYQRVIDDSIYQYRYRKKYALYIYTK